MPKIPVASETLHLDGDYAGLEASLRVNPPTRVKDEMQSGNLERAEAAFSEIVLRWNLEDDEGKPLPIPRNRAEWSELPDELTGQLLAGWGRLMEERAAVPKASGGPSSTTSTTST
jgi:hypothetical protein